jgi:hypothetical protein
MSIGHVVTSKEFQILAGGKEWLTILVTLSGY